MRAVLVSVAIVVAWFARADASSVRVSPVLLDVKAPARATQLTLRNGRASALTVQLRAFRWTQEGGVDRLLPTDALVVSPPMLTLRSGDEYVVRVIRLASHPIDSEESYRVLVDELPEAKAQRGASVSLVIRQSIPVFFGTAGAGRPRVNWSVGSTPSGVAVTARNDGATRLRIANLVLSTEGGAKLGERPGLAGYVLSGSTMSFPLPSRGHAPSAGHLSLHADTEAEPIHVSPILARATR